MALTVDGRDTRLSQLDRLAMVLATGFGSGYLPYAPGTWGSLVAIPIYYALFQLGHVAYLAAAIAALAVGIWASERVTRRLGRKDPGLIVIDEIVGFLMTMAFVTPSWPNIVLGFGVFRAYDILKPPPVRQLEELPGGIGVMMDDYLAGVFGNVTLKVLLFFIIAPPGMLAA